MNQFDIVESKGMRDELVARTEVLAKVKALFLIPGIQMMTSKQVADYYEVAPEAIRKVYDRNRSEVDSDGVKKYKASEVVGQNVTSQNGKKGSRIIQLGDGSTVSINPGATNYFSPRAVLRIGMLLRDSEVAKEVRTQLLNTFEHATVEQKTADINEEDKLLLLIIHSKSEMERAMAIASYKDFTQRHVNELECRIDSLETTLSYMCDGAKKWGNRQIANAMIRAIGKKLGINPGLVWNDLYHQMQYALGIQMAIRKPIFGDTSYVSRIREEEWPSVHKLIGAMAVEHGVDVQATINNFNAQKVGMYL